ASSILQGASWLYFHTADVDDTLDMDTTAQINNGPVKFFFGWPASATINQKAMNINTDVYMAYGTDHTVKMTGNWTIGGSLIFDPYWIATPNVKPLGLDTNGHNLTVAGNLTLGALNLQGSTDVLLSSGTHSIGGNVSVNQSLGVTGLLNFGTSTTTIGGDI